MWARSLTNRALRTKFGCRIHDLHCIVLIVDQHTPFELNAVSMSYLHIMMNHQAKYERDTLEMREATATQ
jgi:hypothetical protein